MLIYIQISVYPVIRYRLLQVQKKELNIEREFLDIYGNPVDLKNVKTGDLILVRIKIFSFSRMHDALVVDFLPAGFELENQDLSNASVNLENAGEVIKKSLEKNAGSIHSTSRIS